jgi:hypothetical protein
MVVVLGGLGQLRSYIEFLVHMESQACCMRGLELLREQIFHDEHVIRLHTRDAARALPLDLCYALLRIRPLSISWAECSVVISCGKVDFDKSG